MASTPTLRSVLLNFLFKKFPLIRWRFCASYENDLGDPDVTAKQIQDEVVHYRGKLARLPQLLRQPMAMVSAEQPPPVPWELLLAARLDP